MVGESFKDAISMVEALTEYLDRIALAALEDRKAACIVGLMGCGLSEVETPPPTPLEI